MKKVNGLVSSQILSMFPSGFPEEIGYSGYVSNCVNLESVLACAAFFSPDFIEYNGAILLSSNIDNDLSKISTRFGVSKKEIEQYNNLLCLSEFFQQRVSGEFEVDKLVDEFAEVIIYYWKARLQFVYPTKNFEFILEDGLFDEDGLCLTFFES